MQHRHLLPQELDLLVDGDAGFGVAPLRAHVEACPDCRAQLDTLRAVAAEIDALPHFTPRHGFADRVMTQVQVIEPWHVALGNQARALLPESTALRVIVAAGAGLAATTISGSAVWVLIKTDLLGLGYGVAIERGSQGLWSGMASSVRELVSAQPDAGSLAVAAAAVAVTAFAAVFAFRRLAAAARTTGN